MGTRADFYVRNEQKEPKMEWIGSIAFDGYPSGIDSEVKQATTEQQYREAVKRFFEDDRDDYTLPENGWPWPWNDSRTTDYAYIFENGKVMASCFGYPLFDPMSEEEEEDDDDDNSVEQMKLENYFPDMSKQKNVRLDKGSGLIIISSKPTTNED